MTPRRHVLPRRYMSCFLAVLLAFSAGCTTQSRVPGPASSHGLRGIETKYGTFRLTADNGSPVHVRPADTLTVTANGQTITAEAERLCRNTRGLSLREEDEDCSQAIRIADWDDIESVHVEQFDGGSTATAVTAATALVVVVAIALAATNGKSKGSRADGSTPGVTERHVSFMAFGWGSRAGRTPRPDTDDDTYATHAGYAEPSEPRPAPVAALPSPAHDAVPLFSGRAVRRATFRPSLRVDSGACAFSDRCITGSARVGATLFDFLELSGGARWERGKTDTFLGTAGAGMNGTFPRWPALSVYIGSQFAFGNGFRFMPSAGVRIKPVADLSIGILPASFTYFAPDRDSPERQRFAYTPSLEVGYEF